MDRNNVSIPWKTESSLPEYPIQSDRAFLFTNQLVLLNGQTKILLGVCQLLLDFLHLLCLTDFNTQVFISDQIHQNTQTDGHGKN